MPENAPNLPTVKPTTPRAPDDKNEVLFNSDDLTEDESEDD
jgi:hypothetical protein